MCRQHVPPPSDQAADALSSGRVPLKLHEALHAEPEPASVNSPSFASEKHIAMANILKAQAPAPVKVEATSLELSVLKAELEQRLRASRAMASKFNKAASDVMVQFEQHPRATPEGTNDSNALLAGQGRLLREGKQRKSAPEAEAHVYCCADALLLPDGLFCGRCGKKQMEGKHTIELEKTIGQQNPHAQSMNSCWQAAHLPLSELIPQPARGCATLAPGFPHVDALAMWIQQQGLENLAPLTARPLLPPGALDTKVTISLSDATSPVF